MGRLAPLLGSSYLFGGHRLVPDPNMVESKLVQRSWKDRLFSWPWRPWKRTRVETRPSRTICTFYTMDCPGGFTRMIHVAHPAVLDELRDKLDELRDKEAGRR